MLSGGPAGTSGALVSTAAATSPAVICRRTTAPSASRSSHDMRRYCSRLSVGASTCGTGRRARSTRRAASATAPRIARAEMVALATKSGCSAGTVPPRSEVPASRPRNVSSCGWRIASLMMKGSLWNTTLAPVMRPARSTPAITSNGTLE